MDPRLLIIYNTCGIHGRDLSEVYGRHMRALLSQHYGNAQLVWSDCCTPYDIRAKIQQDFGKTIAYSFVDTRLTLPVTFNAAILRSIQTFGEFDHYLYVESGINMAEFPNYVRNLVACQVEHPEYGILMGSVQYDNALPEYTPEFVAGNPVVTIPYNKAVNLHVSLFSQHYARAWDNRLIPDIFFSNGSEAAMWYLCAAIGNKWGAYPEPKLFHHGELELPNRVYPSFPPHIPLSGEDNFSDIYLDGVQYGLGWDVLVGFIHCKSDRSKFDEHGYALRPELHPFLKKRLFLSQAKLDYASIEGPFIA